MSNAYCMTCVCIMRELLEGICNDNIPIISSNEPLCELSSKVLLLMIFLIAHDCLCLIFDSGITPSIGDPHSWLVYTKSLLGCHSWCGDIIINYNIGLGTMCYIE